MNSPAAQSPAPKRVRGRLPWYDPAELDTAQREVYDRITGGERAATRRVVPMTSADGRLEGPFNAMLVSPAVGNALQNLGGAIRFASSLTDREREAAILAVAVAHDSDFEWLAHEAVGRTVGLTDDELTSLRDSAPASSFSASELIGLELVRSLMANRDVADELYERAVATLGSVKVVEFVVLVGYYETLALSLRTFRVPLPDDVEAR
jgi:4-carboxymuconolactone decarboxylase